MADPWVRKEVIGDCELWCGDSYKLASKVGEFGAILTDPPYGYGYKPSRNGSVKSAKFSRNFGPEDKLIGDTGKMDFDPSPFLGMAKYQIWWGGNCYAGRLPNSKAWLVWFKADGNTKIDQGHAELAWTNLGFAIRGFNHRWCGMVRDSEHGVQNMHPTQKPIAVMVWCLGFIPKSEVIFDPFLGSGSSLVACAKLGRKGIGIELDPEYFEIACKRVEEAYRQPDLFVEPPAPPTQEAMEI